MGGVRRVAQLPPQIGVRRGRPARPGRIGHGRRVAAKRRRVSMVPEPQDMSVCPRQCRGGVSRSIWPRGHVARGEGIFTWARAVARGCLPVWRDGVRKDMSSEILLRSVMMDLAKWTCCWRRPHDRAGSRLARRSVCLRGKMVSARTFKILSRSAKKYMAPGTGRWRRAYHHADSRRGEEPSACVEIVSVRTCPSRHLLRGVMMYLAPLTWCWWRAHDHVRS
jgi:hypothetical protein